VAGKYSDLHGSAVDRAETMQNREHLADRRRRAGHRADGDDRAIPTQSPTIEKLRAASNRHTTRLWRMERDRS